MRMKVPPKAIRYPRIFKHGFTRVSLSPGASHLKNLPMLCFLRA
jgi:hypothetical protein